MTNGASWYWLKPVTPHWPLRSIGSPVGVRRVDVELELLWRRLGPSARSSLRTVFTWRSSTPAKTGESIETVPRTRRESPGARMVVEMAPWKVQVGKGSSQWVRPAPPIGMPAPEGSATRRIVPGSAERNLSLRSRGSNASNASGTLSTNCATPVPTGSALMRTDVPAGAKSVAVKLPSSVAWAVVKCPVSRVMATTALPGVTAPAAPVSVTSPSAVGGEMLMRAAMGGSSGTNGVGCRLTVSIRSVTPASLTSSRRRVGWRGASGVAVTIYSPERTWS